jgi:phage terminase large subunit-like protein
VTGGEIPACRYVREAAERFLGEKAEAERGEGPWAFRADLAEAAMLFAEQLPNIKGPEAGRPLRLMPWQRFVFTNLFGFVERGTTTRRFRQAVVYVLRGNGKTTFAAPIALYLTFIEGEGGAEGYAAAVTRDQARILSTPPSRWSAVAQGSDRPSGSPSGPTPSTRSAAPASSSPSPPTPSRSTG